MSRAKGKNSTEKDIKITIYLIFKSLFPVPFLSLKGRKTSLVFRLNMIFFFV
ncbi:hypothetical protein LptCag_0189 [Leptospirillum ferriphilum]|uniref:Uncharacterized protein n=1 Tax=Leptospirillum ferriphilum TaxID=178606 RepID=A0A094YK68_9BACT|nr:hypothetical protein LptCag_0189 [Leptospirillum ferriphilum]